MTRYNPRTNNNKDMKDLTEKIAGTMQAKMFNTHIRTSVIVEEAQVRKESLLDYKSGSTVSSDYEAFIEEYLERA